MGVRETCRDPYYKDIPRSLSDSLHSRGVVRPECHPALFFGCVKMDEEYKRDLRWIIRICNNEIMSVYCSSDGKLSATQYARIAELDTVVKWAKEELEHGATKEDCSH